jgi:hypothetical protein
MTQPAERISVHLELGESLGGALSCSAFELELEYIMRGYLDISSSCAAATDMASTQAVPLTSGSAGQQPKIDTASSVDPSPQNPGRPYPVILDDRYYSTMLERYFSYLGTTEIESAMRDIECLSISDRSFEWKTDWRTSISDAARLFMLRGRISREHLYLLAVTFRLSPAFLVGHLGSALKHKPWPVCPPLPSQRSNMGHVQFFTLGMTLRPEERFDFSSMLKRREDRRLAIEKFVSELQPECEPGETTLRHLHLHDRQYFSVEQMISFCFVREDQEDAWVGEFVEWTSYGYCLTCHRCFFD